MVKRLQRNFIYATFTFQSGSIQINMPKTTPQGEFPTLHSNLVLFKSYLADENHIINFFTFQSGSIQIQLSETQSIDF